MAIPNSEVFLLTVNFNHTQENVLSFGSRNEQQSYFNDRVVATLPNTTYINHQKRIIRYDSLYDDINNINYLMFRNKKGKWYYAFVMSKEYINESMTEITYEIDAWQTFMFDINWSKCFVEREHVADDTLGRHTVAEPIKFNYKPSYVLRDLLGTNRKPKLLVGISGTIKGHDSGGIWGWAKKDDDIRAGIVDRVLDGDDDFVHGTSVAIYDLDEIDKVAKLINSLEDKGRDTIAGMTIAPAYMVGDYGSGTTVFKTTMSSQVDLPNFSSLASQSGYTPVNNKLKTSQYCYYEVVNGTGGKLEINGDTTDYQAPKLQLRVRRTLNPYAVVYGYNSVYGRSEILTTSPFDKVSWREDVFAQYLEGEKGTRFAETFKNLSMAGLGMATATATGGASLPISQAVGVGMGVRGATNIIDTMGREYDMNRTKDRERGEATTGGTNLAGGNNFRVVGYTPSARDMKRADDFLTRYGYQVNEYKIPNLRTRENFNYVKLSDVNIWGNVEAQYMEQIIRMFEKGTTLWHNHKTFKNFTGVNKIREVK